jgi:hypothetical protein
MIKYFGLSNTFHEMDEEIVTPDAGIVVVNTDKKEYHYKTEAIKFY